MQGTFEKMKTKLMIMSDAPTAGSGLGRICGDLARRIAENMPYTFDVCTFGYGGVASRHLPYHQYVMEGVQNWVTPTLPEVWRDWVGDEKGILLSIWDLSRLGWLLRPEKQCENPVLREFLLKKPFKIWSYLPIDADGPNEKLTYPLKETLKGADRVLAYGKWGAGVVDRTMELPEDTTHYLPHGLDTSIFHEYNRTSIRKDFGSHAKACTLMGNYAYRVKGDEVLISIIATNQTRKDWQLGIEVVAKLAIKHNVRLWIKTDVLERHWSIPALLLDYGIADRTMVSLGDLTDEEMACAYSASDLVLGIAPEGFGYVHAESLACGTPCITSSYAGGAELVPVEMQVDPVGFRYESIWSCKRPVYRAEDWVVKAEEWIGKRAELDPQYNWDILWPRWENWLREGVK